MLKEFKERRSIRKFLPKPVEKENLDIIIKNALIAPSSRNRKPWEFVIITEKSLLKELSLSRQHGSSFIKGAPMAILVLADERSSDVWIEDSSIVAFTIQLTAHALGLGSCWIQVRNRMHSEKITTESYIKNLYNIPEGYSVECIIALGYPDEKKESYTEDDMDLNKVHFNYFK